LYFSCGFPIFGATRMIVRITKGLPRLWLPSA
jgi:hypothetical protein